MTSLVYPGIHKAPENLMKIDWPKIPLENPGLSITSARFLGEGWNARAYLVNDELVFRFPKRPEHWQELEREIKFLAYAASDLPLRVPTYLTVSPNSLAAPCGYAVYRYIKGDQMDAGLLSLRERVKAADTIAGFLRALHSLNPSADVASILPRDDERKLAKEYLGRAEHGVVPHLQPTEVRALREQFEMYLTDADNFSFCPVVVHADFSGDHILATGGSVVGVIDFGDVSYGDPDYDFMYLFVDFGWRFVEEVAKRYGHAIIERLRTKVRYFSIVDQIGTILDGAGRALDGQQEAAWVRLRQLLEH